MLRFSLLLALCCCSPLGCSWIFMTPAPEVVAAPNYPLDCTNGRAAPVLDVICGGYFVANGAYLLAQKSCDDASLHVGDSCLASGTRTGGALLSAGLAVLCVASAVSGFGYANRCQEKKDLNALCITGDVNACAALRPGWTPLPPPSLR